MIQSTSYEAILYGLHAAIIMDGNGRWATRQGLPRVAGHRAGAAAVHRAIIAASSLGIDTLTLFAFSAGNWERPPHEVTALMEIFRDFFIEEKTHCAARGVQVSVIGRRDRLTADLREAIQEIESITARRRGMHLRIAIDYSARDAIVLAANRLKAQEEVTYDKFSQMLAEVTHSVRGAPDVDLLIRTGGEQRLSDCLLWECPYAELIFTERMWPEFSNTDLESAVHEFLSRRRRFGRVPDAEPSLHFDPQRGVDIEQAALKIV